MVSFVWFVVLIGFAIVAAIAGLLLGRAAGARAVHAARAADRAEAERRLADARHSLALEYQRDSARADASLAAARADAEARAEHALEREESLAKAEQTISGLHAELRTKSAELESAKKHIELEALNTEKKLKLLTDAEEKLGNQFKVLAAEIFREKSQRFKEESEASLGGLLNPLRERMGEFQQRVEALQQEGLVGRTELREQLGHLKALNEQLSLEASGLARALKGSTKTQGDWGEVLLTRMLDSAGLRAGQEYHVQQSLRSEEGRQMRPDIVLDLPGDKHLVIDSKVSLNSYTEHCSAEDEPTRKQYIERHATSLRNHIDGLSKKSYQALHQLSSLDFVVMFVPIEPAYLLAIAHDDTLWQRAWERDVLLVSPGTLFPVIRTIAHIWKQEKQTRNIEEIVRQGGGLYDQVALFARTFVDVGERIETAKAAYEKARGQLTDGKGNVLRRIERLRDLGVSSTKKLPAALAVDTDDEEPADRAEQPFEATQNNLRL